MYAAPQICLEAAWQFALAGALKKASAKDGDWMPGVLMSSAIPFIIVLILAAVLGWTAHHACPDGETKLAQGCFIVLLENGRGPGVPRAYGKCVCLANFASRRWGWPLSPAVG